MDLVAFSTQKPSISRVFVHLTDRRTYTHAIADFSTINKNSQGFLLNLFLNFFRKTAANNRHMILFYAKLKRRALALLLLLYL